MHTASRLVGFVASLLVVSVSASVNGTNITAAPTSAPTSSCFEENVQYEGIVLKTFYFDKTEHVTYSYCYTLCNANAYCTDWTFLDSAQDVCILFEDEQIYAIENRPGFYSGKRDCPDIEDNLRRELLNSTMTPTPSPTSGAPTMYTDPVDSCGEQAHDIAFIVDASSQSNSVWTYTKDYIRQLGSAFQLGSNATRLAMIEFADDASTEWTFEESEATDMTEFQDATDDLSLFSTSKSSFAGGLIYAQNLFAQTQVRENVQRTAIFISSSRSTSNGYCASNGYKSNSAKCLSAAAQDLVNGADGVAGTEDDVTLIFVSIGTSKTKKFLDDSTSLFVQSSAADLKDTANTLVDSICDL